MTASPDAEALESVMKVFVRDGRITHIPVSLAKRRILLRWLAEDFDVDRRGLT